MSTAAVKRKRLEPQSASQILRSQENIIYELIKSKRELGIWIKDIKQETGILESVVNKCLKTLVNKKQVKEVTHFQSKGKKMYVAVEFEPSVELTGGILYDGTGNLDEDFIQNVSKLCKAVLGRMKVGTMEDIIREVKGTGAIKFEIPHSTYELLVGSLVYSGVLIEIQSTGLDEFSSIPRGIKCYKCAKNVFPSTFASIPCGVCPHMSICTPDGLVSPNNCVYLDKWLDF